MQMNMSVRLVAICAVALLGGCAFGKKVAYQNVKPDLEVKGTNSVAVATWDQRPYVVSGGKAPTFVGLSRGGYGNPFNVHTESGGALADDVSKSIAGALKERGFSATPVLVPATDSRRAVNEKIAEQKADRGLLITLKEWKSDTYVNTKLIYDVIVRVTDVAGEELAQASFEGKDNLGGGAVADAYRRKVEEWFADPKIVKALQ